MSAPRARTCVLIRATYARRVSASTISSSIASDSRRSAVIGVRRSCETAAMSERREQTEGDGGCVTAVRDPRRRRGERRAADGDRDAHGDAPAHQRAAKR